MKKEPIVNNIGINKIIRINNRNKKIVNLFLNGIRPSEIARKFNISKEMVSKILYKELNLPLSLRKERKLSEVYRINLKKNNIKKKFQKIINKLYNHTKNQSIFEIQKLIDIDKIDNIKTNTIYFKNNTVLKFIGVRIFRIKYKTKRGAIKFTGVIRVSVNKKIDLNKDNYFIFFAQKRESKKYKLQPNFYFIDSINNKLKTKKTVRVIYYNIKKIKPFNKDLLIKILKDT